MIDAAKLDEPALCALLDAYSDAAGDFSRTLSDADLERADTARGKIDEALVEVFATAREAIRQRALLAEALAELERDEVKIEGEWGCGRNLEELECDGVLRPIIYSLRAATTP